MRDFCPAYLDQLVALYQEVFAGDVQMDNGGVFSWGEFRKCPGCGIKYSREEARELVSSPESGRCKQCGIGISGEKLMPFWSREDIESLVQGVLDKPKGEVKLGFSGNEMVGFVMCFVNPYAPDIAYIPDIGVDPARRKAGIATALLSVVDGWAEDNRLSWAYLRTDARNLAAVRLFEANGFEKTGFTEQDQSVQDSDYRIYLRKNLPKGTSASRGGGGGR